MEQKVEPQAEHQWLQQLVGEWTVESDATMAPGEAPMKWRGHEKVRSLGGLWVVAEGESEMPDGGKGQMIMTLGYDPAKGQFVGTFMASMMTMLWTYEGELDADRRVLTLSAEGPSMTGDGKALYHDIVEIVDRNTRTFRSEMQMPDGQWHQFMRAEYKRVDVGVPSV